jgi:hypothetical protein
MASVDGALASKLGAAPESGKFCPLFAPTPVSLPLLPEAHPGAAATNPKKRAHIHPIAARIPFSSGGELERTAQ